MRDTTIIGSAGGMWTDVTRRRGNKFGEKSMSRPYASIRYMLMATCAAAAILGGSLPGSGQTTTAPTAPATEVPQGVPAASPAASYWDLLDINNSYVLESKGTVRNDHSPAQLSWMHSQGTVNFQPTSRDSEDASYSLDYINLGTTSPLLPRQLSAESLRLDLGLAKIGKWNVGFSIGAGYAGSTPFNDAHAVYGIASLFTYTRLNKHDTLAFYLGYNGNSQFMPDVPLPGFAFQHRGKTFSYTIGLPVTSLNWTFLPRTTLSLKYEVPFDGRAELAYQIIKPISLFTDFETRTGAFRVDSYPTSDRLFISYDSVAAGVEFSLLRHLKGNISGGYVFNQEFAQGFDARDARSFASITNQPFVSFGMALNF